jgi:hypothetical protein
MKRKSCKDGKNKKLPCQKTYQSEAGDVGLSTHHECKQLVSKSELDEGGPKLDSGFWLLEKRGAMEISNS